MHKLGQEVKEVPDFPNYDDVFERRHCCERKNMDNIGFGVLPTKGKLKWPKGGKAVCFEVIECRTCKKRYYAIQ